MTAHLTVGHGSALGANPHGIEFSRVNRDAPGYAEYVARLEREGDSTLDDDPPILVALCAPAMGSGKSAVAEHLVKRHGFVALKFAGPLKAMTRTLLTQLGEDAATVERRVEGDLKEAEIPTLRRSCRYVMQRLGTEFGRDLLHEDVWASITAERASKMLAAGRSVVVDDMRYLNELNAIRGVGGVGVRVKRNSATVTSGHSSEGELNGIPMDEIDNNWPTLEELHRHIDAAWLPHITKSLSNLEGQP